MPTKEAAELAVELAAEFSSLDQPSEDPEILFDALYEEVPTETARIVSRMDREKNNFKAPALTYGEITFSAFKEMFDRLYAQGLPNSGGCFIDLGCGSGRPVFAATLIHDFDMCCGIEILEGLFHVCHEVHVVWRRDIKFRCSRRKQDTDIRFYEGDVLRIGWHDADVVFCNSTCFPDKLMKRIANKANKLRSGTFFITTTKPLPSAEYETLETFMMPETWGDATVFIQRKLFNV